MNPAQLTAQANQAAAQGQQLLGQDQSQASSSNANYGAYSTQANQAAQQAQSQAQYMQGAGSGANVYNQQLQNQISQFDPNITGQLSSANQSLFGLTGALNGASQQFNTPGGVGAYGLSAPALAGYESAALSPLQQGVSNANTQVGALNSQLGTLQSGANQATTSQVQTEQGSLTGLTQAAAAYQAQASTALQNAQFYSQLAQQQGGLNAQQQQAYATAIQGYTTANAAMLQAQASAKYLASQTVGQNLTNQGSQNTLNSQAAAVQAAAQKAQNASIIQGYKNQGLTPAATVGNTGSQPVYAASF